MTSPYTNVVLGSDLLSGRWQRLRRFSAHRQRVENAAKAVDDSTPASAAMNHVKVIYISNLFKENSAY